MMVLSLAACQATPSPTPSTDAYEVALVSPSLLPLAVQWLQGFNQNTLEPRLTLTPMSYSAAVEALEGVSASIFITSQDPPDEWWASPLGAEPIAVVTNTTNPVDRLTRSELIQIISGQVNNWETFTDESTPMEVIIPIPGDEMRIRFLNQLSPGVRVSSNARLAADPAMVIHLVAEDPGRIGILPFSLVTADLNMIQIDGLQPDDDGYPFIMDILATAPQEPEGVIRQWLIWLQEQLGIPQPDMAIPEASTTPEPIISSPSSDGFLSTSTPPPTRTPSASQAVQ
jgi:ABC-type phosphate transport system substrate-binding protein